MIPKGPALRKIILSTLKTCADMVGSTLGPGGQSVIIEHQDNTLAPLVTKDGVTVFRSLGFLNSSQQTVMESTRDASIRTASEAGDGPQPLWSKVLTPNGFVPMGDIRPGMKICGTSGTVQDVVEVFHKGQKEIAKVTFEGGATVECCPEHLWTVTTNYGATKTITTKEMETDFKRIGGDGYPTFRYYTPKTCVDFGNSTTLPIDPYLVGVLIGDGSLTDSGSIELSLGKKKEHVIDKLNLPDGFVASTSYVPSKNSYRVKIKGKDENGLSMRNLLGGMGLRNTDSYTKLIPETYLLSSVQDRRALLSGLIDTDGHVNGRGRFEFSTVSDKLATDFSFLCRSLGISLYHTVHERKPGNGSYSDRPIHRFVELKGNKYGDKIVNIEFTGKFTEMKCIKVSNPDHLYITDNFISTHNTTTATILTEAFVRRIYDFCDKNPRVSPQRVLRTIQKLYDTEMRPGIEALKLTPNLADAEGREQLFAVAKISGNGDTDLAKAVMGCFDIIGDEGNVTITEANGPSKYLVQKIEGYPCPIGYEESCGPFYQKFVNDPGTQSCILGKPSFLLHYGRITDFQTIFPLLSMVANSVSQGEEIDGKKLTHNVVLVATGFSETVLANLAAGFSTSGALNVYPMLVPAFPVKTGAYDFIADIAAITGAKIFDPIESPLQNFFLDDLGIGPSLFEATRFRSNIIGRRDDDKLLERVDQIQKQLSDSITSEMERNMLRERVAKLTSGIAKLVVQGSSNGEIKERRDRAEDAICAVREAIKHGALPGGGVTLKELSVLASHLGLTSVQSQKTGYTPEELKISLEVVAPALLEPVHRLYQNAGYTQEEIDEMVPRLSSLESFDVMDQKWVDPVAEGLLDSLPAVREALKNAISISSVLGTSGGIVNFARDREVERAEARDTADFLRSIDPEGFSKDIQDNHW